LRAAGVLDLAHRDNGSRSGLLVNMGSLMEQVLTEVNIHLLAVLMFILLDLQLDIFLVIATLFNIVKRFQVLLILLNNNLISGIF
jgi:hypothetical protein